MIDFVRILMLTQWFYPEPSFKGLPFAKELVALGHDVEVITGFPNYPGGKIYEGYRLKLFQREIVEGIPIIRVALYPSHDDSVLHRMANYASFALSSLFIGTLLVKQSDLVYVYHPPGTIGLAAVAIKWFRRMPFVYDILDPWPESIEVSEMITNRAVLWIIDKWCRFVYNQASKIVVPSPGLKKLVQSKGVPYEKVEVIYNWCDEEHLSDSEGHENLSKELGLIDRFNVMYAGNIGTGQGLAALLEAASMIKNRLPEIQFVLVGDGLELSSLKHMAKQMDLFNVLFLEQRDIDEMGAVLNLSDVLLVHLKDEELFRITIPSKTQAYMNAGKPILMAVRGDASTIVENARAGLSCTPEDANCIALAVEELYCMPEQQLEEMGKNGLDYYRTNMSKSVGVKKFENIFRQIADRE